MSVMSPGQDLGRRILDDLQPEAALESSQLTRFRRVPLQRKKLSNGLLVLMWTLRVYVILALPLVAYVFFSSMKG